MCLRNAHCAQVSFRYDLHLIILFILDQFSADVQSPRQAAITEMVQRERANIGEFDQ